MPLTRGRTSGLLISPAERDHELLEKLFAEQGWTLFSARSLGSASILLRQENISVVLTERTFPPALGGTYWRSRMASCALLS